MEKAEWSKKVRVGGIIAGDDFIDGRRSYLFVHSKYVVDAWAKAYHIQPVFIFAKDSRKSWMWVKTN